MNNLSPAFLSALSQTEHAEFGPNGPEFTKDPVPTFGGITLETYQVWLGPQVGGKCPVENCPGCIASLQELSLSDIQQIYHDLYWAPIHGDDLAAISPELAKEVFDMAVNGGVSRAVKLLQQCCNDNGYSLDGAPVVEDGKIGPLTLGAATSVTFEQYNSMRRDFYAFLAAKNVQDAEYLEGWDNRLDTELKAEEAESQTENQNA